MKPIKLGSPRPYSIEKCFKPVHYPISRRTYLPIPFSFEFLDFFQVIASRKSRREFKSLNIDKLSKILWYSAHTKSIRREAYNFIWQHRPVASAGGRHPIDIIVLMPIKSSWSCNVYDNNAHCLCELRVDENVIEDLMIEVEDVVPCQEATLLWFVAQPERTLSKYSQGDSLIWRDAGVLLGHITLVAEALSIACCPIGITGDETVQKLIGSPEPLMGMGGCLIGEKP